jgi:ATP-dependent Zn protease
VPAPIAHVVNAAGVVRMIITGMGGSGMNMGTLEAFLSAMDGMEEPRGMVNKALALLGFKPLPPPRYKYLMIGATNRVSAIDPALLRAGRFGRKIKVGYPRYEGRLRTYEGYLRRKEHRLDPAQVEWAARNHHRGTGAEIKDIVNEALLITFREEGREPGVITFRDLMDAMLWVRHGESEGQFERHRNRDSVAVHEASHAVTMHHLLAETARIWVASVEQHGRAGGFVSPSPLYDDWKMWRSDMVDEMAVSLASRVGEEMFFGQASNGHGGDGPHATSIAERMVMLGHGSTIGFYGPERRPKGEWQDEVESILAEGLDRARGVLAGRKDQVRAVADMLLLQGSVPGNEIHDKLEEMEAAA